MITLAQIQLRITEEIKTSKRTQTEIAKELNVTQSTIAHYVKGDIAPSLDTFANLCKILDLDANEILCLK